MSQTLGMNPDEVRAKAQSLASQLAALDGLAQQVSLTRLASLNPLSYGVQPGSLIVAPASIALLSGAVADVRAARSSAEELTGRLGAEASQQEHVSSASDDSYSGGSVPWVPSPSQPHPPRADEPFDLLRGARDLYNGYSAVAGIVTTARWITAGGFLATSVRGANSLQLMSRALAFSPLYQGITAVDGVVAPSVGALGYIATGAGVLFNGISTIESIREGDVGGAVWNGAKTLIAAGGFLPPPAGTVFMAVSAGIAVGELIYDNWDSITSFVGGAAEAVGDFAGDAADAVGGAVDAVGDFVSDAWPW